MSVYEPLTREEVIKAVEHKGPARVPVSMARWWGEGLGDQYGDRLREFDKYPDDCVRLWIPMPGTQRGAPQQRPKRPRLRRDAGLGLAACV
jgi:hypothetical protein